MARIIKADEAGISGSPRAVLLDLSDLAEEARKVVLEARKEAARIVAAARTKVDEELKAAAQRGRSEGFAAGREEGFAEGAKQAAQKAMETLTPRLEEAAAVAGKVVAELQSRQAELVQQSAGGVLELAIALAEKVVSHVAVSDGDTARANLAKALEAAGAAGEVLVAVNPAQMELLQEHCRQLVETLGTDQHVRLVADETIEAGGVRLSTRHGEIDATVRTQLQRVAAALVGREPGEMTSVDEGIYVPSCASELRNANCEMRNERAPSSLPVRVSERTPSAGLATEETNLPVGITALFPPIGENR